MAFETYKGITRNSGSIAAGGNALDANFTEIANRIGPVNFAAVINPWKGNDSANGFYKGSRWINTVSGYIFDCIDDTPGAAVWVQHVGLDSSGLIPDRLIPKITPGKVARVPDANTLGLYPFDGDPYDLKRLHDATLVATPGYANPIGGVPGRALSLNGTTQYVTIAGQLDAPTSAGFTIGLRVRPAVSYAAATARLLTKFWEDTFFGPGVVDWLDIYVNNGRINVSFYPHSATQTLLTSIYSGFGVGDEVDVVFSHGPPGSALWVNGNLDTWQPILGVPSTSASVQPFVLGAYYNATQGLSNLFHGDFDDVWVRSGQALPEEIHAFHNGTPYVAGSEESGRWATVSRNALLSGSGGSNWDADSADEPTNTVLLSDGVTRIAAYTGWSNAVHHNGIGLATVTFDGTRETWTRRGTTPVVGLGHGGEAGDTNAPWLVKGTAAHPSRLYLYYMAGYGSTAGIKLATSDDDGVTWSAQGVVLPSPAWTDGIIANPGVYIDPRDGQWYMTFAALVSGVYKTGIARCTKADGTTWIADDRGVVTVTGFNGASQLVAVRTLAYVAGKWRGWGHFGANGNLPTFVGRIDSDDLRTWDFTGPAGATIFPNGETVGSGTANQIADAVLEEYGGFVHIRNDLDFDDSGVSGNFYGSIVGRSWRGTLEALVS
jgi:hypothetical protein